MLISLDGSKRKYHVQKVEKSSLVIENIENGNKKYSNWIGNIEIANEKYPNWKLVMRKLKLGNWKC